VVSETRRRAALAVPPHRTLAVVTRPHEEFYRPLLADMRTRAVVVQPENRGTAPAILYALLRIAAMAPQEHAVAFFPSDHFVSDEGAFMAQVEQAFEACHQRPDLVMLLGIPPDRAEPAYGWIEPGGPVPGLRSASVKQVRGFWEKPPIGEAEPFRVQGWLLNSLAMVGSGATLLALL